MSSLPYKVKAIFEYKSGIEDDLNFSGGQIITVTEEEGSDWYVGEYTDSSGMKQEGLFPRNFVEKYEPAAPPRPVRARPRKDAPGVEQDSPSGPVPSEILQEPTKAIESIQTTHYLPTEEKAPSSVPPRAIESSSESTKQPTTAKAAPPVAEKPSSFRDRIAAFNKGMQAPVAPIKPGAPPGGSAFVKKPFVAPPPARDAYVPTARDNVPTPRIYRREEDPEIAQRIAQDQEDAERAGLASTEGDDLTEDTPKPTSLKERIALLQKQQQEQASRRAELAQNKEKPKRPPKKRTESSDNISLPADVEPGELTRVPTGGSVQRISIDSSRELPRPPVRRQSRDQKPSDARTRETFSDSNDADQSGAGDTTEEAEGSTEVDEGDDRARGQSSLPSGRMATGPPLRTTSYDERTDIKEEEEQEETEADIELRRKEELRQRMAKMSGGMGMAGMFGMPMGMPMGGLPSRTKRQSGGGTDSRPSLEQTPTSPTQRIPMIPLPGMHVQRSDSPDSEDTEPEVPLPSTTGHHPEEVLDIEGLEAMPPPVNRDDVRAPPPPTPQERPVPSIPNSVAQAAAPPPPPAHGGRPPPPPNEARPVPPPPPAAIRSPSPGSESDDEASLRFSQPTAMSPPFPAREQSIRAAPPPIPVNIPGRPEGPRSPPQSSAKRTSFMQESASPSSPQQIVGDNRLSRAPPVPIGLSPMSPTGELRAPPPPPPTTVLPQRAPPVPQNLPLSGNDTTDDGESDYEGDYDTDIASGATHKEALKSYDRQSSLDENNLQETTPTHINMAPPPPIPQTIPAPVQRAAPPPPPHQGPPRLSMDAPRSMPPVPPPREPLPSPKEDEDYDPYRYTAPTHGIPASEVASGPWVSDRPIQERIIQESDPSLYGPPPQRPMDRAPPLPPPQAPHPQDRAVPPPPPSMQQGPPAIFSGSTRQSREAPRQSIDAKQSLDVSRPPPVSSTSTISRRSTDQPRLSSEQSSIAQDVDLAETSLWWTHANTPPPVFQNRNDVLCEFEESSTSKRGGRTTISKDVYVLFQDYSQTFITARFDSKDPADVALEQRHEGPPPLARQEKLEAAHHQFGPAIASAAGSRVNHVVGDGSSQALVLDILRKMPGALQPVGVRAYGALVYANLANATIQQFDEIRSGDIMTFRNAKFQGKHGAMHAKYNEDVGKPDHVAIVAEWDGTKKKIRAFEQGREKKGVRAESFRVGDLRSGEVKVWRVVGRNWVGWEGGA